MFMTKYKEGQIKKTEQFKKFIKTVSPLYNKDLEVQN